MYLINDVINDKIEEIMSVKKKQTTAAEQLKMIPDSVQNLSLNDRAMIYAIVWCSSDKSNLEHYPTDNLLEVARIIRKFLLSNQ